MGHFDERRRDGRDRLFVAFSPRTKHEPASRGKLAGGGSREMGNFQVRIQSFDFENFRTKDDKREIK